MQINSLLRRENQRRDSGTEIFGGGGGLVKKKFQGVGCGVVEVKI